MKLYFFGIWEKETRIMVFKRWGDFSFFKNLLLEQIEGAVVLFTSFNLAVANLQVDGNRLA